MENRKQHDTSLFTGTLLDLNGTGSLAGSALTISMRGPYGNMIFSAQAATIVSPADRTWSYAPADTDVANTGAHQVEIKEVTSGGKVIYHPHAGYDPLFIEALLSSTGSPPVDPSVQSITLPMLAQQTPGSVLLYDAYGNAIAYAPGALGSVLTSNGTGAAPTWKSRYLGHCGARTYFPGAAGVGLANMMSYSRHPVLDDMSAIQFCIANTHASVANANSETGPGGATTATATVEFETGRRWRLTLAGNPSMAIPDGGWIWTDPIPWVAPRGSVAGVYLYRTNAAGCVYSPNAQDHPYGEYIEYNVGVDKTASGVISGADTSNWAGPCGMRGLMSGPSVVLFGGPDSITLGEGDTSDGAGARGGVARRLQQLGVPWLNQGIGGTGPHTFLSGSHALRLELASLCSHAIFTGGINDLAFGDAQMRADMIAIAALLPSATKKYITALTPWTTGSWGDLAGQSLTAFQGVIDSHNVWRRTIPAPFTKCYDVNAVVQSGTTGKWKFPGYTADGLHPSAVGHAAIRDSGVIQLGDFLP